MRLLTSKLLLHLGAGEHVDVLETQWLHNVLLDPVVQACLCGSFEDQPGPINIYSIFPCLARLVHKWHAKNVSNVGTEKKLALVYAAGEVEALSENFIFFGALHHLLEHIKSYRTSIVSQLRIKKFIAESSGVRQEHSESDLVLLVDQGAIILQNLDFGQFWTELVDLLVVVETQDSLFNSLHTSHCSEKLRAGRNPEDSVHCHRLLAVETFLWICQALQSLQRTQSKIWCTYLSRSTGSDLFSILVNCNENESCNASVLVACDRVKACLHRGLSLLIDHLDLCYVFG